MKKTPDGVDEQALEYLANLSTVHIDKSGPPDEYNKVQPSKALAEESKVAPLKYFSLAGLPVVKVTVLIRYYRLLKKNLSAIRILEKSTKRTS